MSVEGPQPAGPLFIGGSPRSGTSVLVDAAFAAGFKGFREGNLLGLLQPLRDRVDAYFRRFPKHSPKTLTAHVGPQEIYNCILQVFKQTIDALNPERPWVDNTCNTPT